LHAFMNGGDIGRLHPENDGCEIASQRAFDALDGLVGPRFDRYRLAPALHTVSVSQSHHNRWPHRRFEGFELADELVVEPADLHATDLAHCSLVPDKAHGCSL